MFKWNSHAAMMAFLLMLLSMDAVFGGTVQLQRSRLPTNDNNILGESKHSETLLRKSRELNADESSSKAALAETDSKSSDSEVNKLESTEPVHTVPFPDDDFFNDDYFSDGKARMEKQEDANDAIAAVAYIAGAAATMFTKPIISHMPPKVNKAIVGFASFINGFSKNNTQQYRTLVYPGDSPSHNTNISSRQPRELPAYEFDGIVPTAMAWAKSENMDKVDSIAPSAEEFAPYLSLRGPDAARLGLVDPVLTLIGAVRRAVATEFLTAAVVMAIAHAARIFYVNLPTMLPIFIPFRMNSRSNLDLDKPTLVQDLLDSSADTDTNTNTKAGTPFLAEQAERLAREVVAAVTRDQCAERAACLIGAHCTHYSFTPTVMRLLRSPEPHKEQPNHPVWLAFRDAAEGRITPDKCDQLYAC